MHHQSTPEPTIARWLVETNLSYEIDLDTGCWNWTGTQMAAGYGAVNHNEYAHRFSYEQACGPIPKGWHIHHRCENRRCVNPEHLECLPASEHHQRHARLTNVEIEAILALKGILSTDRVAEMFGISPAYAGRIMLGRSRNPSGTNIEPPKAPRVRDDLTDAIQIQICDMYKSGKSQREIARDLSITRDRVRSILIHFNLAKKWSGYERAA